MFNFKKNSKPKKNKMGENGDKWGKIKRVIFYCLIAAFVVSVYVLFQDKDPYEGYKKVDYSDFVESERDDAIKSVTVEGENGTTNIYYTTKLGVQKKTIGLIDAKALKELSKKDVTVTVLSNKGLPFLVSAFKTILPIVILVGLLMLMTKGVGNPNGAIKMIDKNDLKYGFDDVKGCDEAKLEASEVVDFLKHPERYKASGAKVPSGLLLIGPPGTGKTLLASAIAKEANVPFFNVAGSDFSEKYVGVGSARVRALFKRARKEAPCIIFIDEMDSLAKKRGDGDDGASRESDNTLNQFLVEVDGLKKSDKPIFVIGATNRPDSLDSAIRAGRFDRKIYVDLPDVKGREEILKLYTDKIKLDPNVNLRSFALYTQGASGSELSVIVNEACILAARDNVEVVTQRHLQEAYDKMSMGVEKTSNALTKEAKLKTALHESGHAVVAMVIDNAMPVHKVTIIPRGRSLGLTRFLQNEENLTRQREEFIAMIATVLGGRAAEMLFMNTQTTGVSNDIEVATSIARNMVIKYGMSSIGPVSFSQMMERNGNSISLGEISDHTQAMIEREVLGIINECDAIAIEALKSHRDLVIKMTSALMEMETIDDQHIYNLKNGYPINDEAGHREYYEKRDSANKKKIARIYGDGALNGSELNFINTQEIEEFIKDEFDKRSNVFTVINK